MAKRVHAAIVVGHGSLRSASGSAMIRIAARLREQGVAPIVEAGFLNYNRPTFAEAVEKCLAQGANELIVQPYFLIAGVYVVTDLPKLVKATMPSERGVHFHMAEPLGAHTALVKLAYKRLQAVDPVPDQTTGLLFVAHGTPMEAANVPLTRVLQRVQTMAGYGPAVMGYLDCNQPDIPTAIAQLVETGVPRIAILPYFLQLGRHVCDDLPTLFAEAKVRHPTTEIRIAEPLGYDLLLVEAVAERIMSAIIC